MTFGMSAHLDWFYSNAPHNAASCYTRQMIEILGGTHAEIELFSQRQLRNGELINFELWARRTLSVNADNNTAKHARKYFAAQALAYPIFSREPFAKEPICPAVTRMLKTGGDSLFEVGKPQFEKLAILAADILKWFSLRSENQMILIESPLGNSVPVSVIHKLAERQGVKSKVITWNCPRNDRPSRGRTVELSAAEIIRDLPPSSVAVLVDDAITGTRFLKTFDAFRKKMKNGFLAVAMVFQDPAHQQRTNDQLKRLKKRMATHSAETNFENTIVEFPALPLFNIDQHAPVNWSTPVIWGETDLIAGKRKVNLIFNFIEYLQFVLKNLILDNSQVVNYLELAWRENTEGVIYVWPRSVMQSTFAGIISKLDVDWIHKELWVEAQNLFPDDYNGSVQLLLENDAKKRWSWLRDFFLKSAEQRLASNEAGLLWRAFDTVFAGSAERDNLRPDRDHAYAAYALPYNDNIRALHNAIVDKVVSLC